MEPRTVETPAAVEEKEAVAAATARRRLSVQAIAYRYGVVVIWGLLIIGFGIARPDTFLTISNFETMFGIQSALLLLALSLVVTLTVAEFDLSVASILGLSATVVAVLNGQHDWPLLLTIVIGLAVGLVAGAINGFVVVVCDVDAIIVTLGMGTFLLGVGIWVSGSTAVGGVSHDLVVAMTDSVAGMPLPFFYSIAVAVILWYVLRFTPLGRYLLFVGRNRDVSRLAGLNVNRLRFGAYMAGGLIAALAGIIAVGQGGGFQADTSQTLLLPAFAAAFLGAAVIEPGRFNVWGTVIAIYFLITGITGLQLVGLSGWIEDVFYGGALVVAVTASRLLAGRSKV